MMNKTIILKLIGEPTDEYPYGDPFEILPKLAQECLDNFGEGMNPDAEIQEGFGVLSNTPVQEGYYRFTATPAFAQAIEYVFTKYKSQYAELIRVEDVQRPFLLPSGEELGIMLEVPYSPEALP